MNLTRLFNFTYCRLVDLLASPFPSISSESVDEAKRALTTNFAPMYHTNLNHWVPSSVFPLLVPTMVTEAPVTADWKSYHIQPSVLISHIYVPHSLHMDLAVAFFLLCYELFFYDNHSPNSLYPLV